MTGQKQYCTLRVADLLLGIEVGEIQEIIRDTSFTPVPMAHPAIRGLINLRGQIVTAIDLRRRAGLASADEDSKYMTMVLGTAEEPLALVVDSVGDVVEVAAEAFEPPPDTLRGEARRMIDGAYKLERELLLVLNLQVVLDLQATPEETIECQPKR
jgi:purine-binding chemotaxis protein CheW